MRQKKFFFFFGVDVPASVLPYLPDMGPSSAFVQKGCWHHYEIHNGIFVAYLQPGDSGNFKMHHVLQVVTFVNESRPRVFLDRREVLSGEKVISLEDLQRIDKILARKQIALV